MVVVLAAEIADFYHCCHLVTKDLVIQAFCRCSFFWFILFSVHLGHYNNILLTSSLTSSPQPLHLLMSLIKIR